MNDESHLPFGDLDALTRNNQKVMMDLLKFEAVQSFQEI